ncbi:MAG TPA: DUF4345 domain-containing protein [Microscillaceae bacterium]|nr:DUF4345 domain-containing protein [Microscillaceae bacterium]
MKNSKVLKGFLILSGLLLTFIGGATLFMPVAMKASAGINIAGNISVINDTRASSALLMVAALLIISGAFSRKLAFTSSLLSVILFLSIGVGRIISIVSDGMPVDGLVKATGLELVLGITGAILFKVYQDKQSFSH